MGSPKLLDQVRDKIRIKHYSIRTEQAYVDWIKRFILFHGKKHPSELGRDAITKYLTHLAKDKQVAASPPDRNQSGRNTKPSPQCYPLSLS